MRRIIAFDCTGDTLIGTLDSGTAKTGLLIVSGGNEIRSGAHSGQSTLAATIAAKGHPVFRYDRRGTGDSAGMNAGFLSSAADIAAAVAAFRAAAPEMKRVVALGNCDAATALALFHAPLAIDALILANPWVIEEGRETIKHESAKPPAAAIRARYWQRIKNPRTIIDLLTGKISVRKLAGGLAVAARREKPTALALKLTQALQHCTIPVTLLVARRDTTALAFMAAWHDTMFKPVRQKSTITLTQFDTASHSFADTQSKDWLIENIQGCLAV